MSGEVRARCSAVRHSACWASLAVRDADEAFGPHVIVHGIRHDHEAVGLVAESRQESSASDTLLGLLLGRVDTKQLHVVAVLLVDVKTAALVRVHGGSGRASFVLMTHVPQRIDDHGQSLLECRRASPPPEGGRHSPSATCTDATSAETGELARWRPRLTAAYRSIWHGCGTDQAADCCAIWSLVGQLLEGSAKDGTVGAPMPVQTFAEEARDAACFLVEALGENVDTVMEMPLAFASVLDQELADLDVSALEEDEFIRLSWHITAFLAETLISLHGGRWDWVESEDDPATSTWGLTGWACLPEACPQVVNPAKVVLDEMRQPKPSFMGMVNTAVDMSGVRVFAF